MTLASPIKDNPIHRRTINEIADDDYEKFLNEIRERRLKPIQVYAEGVALKAKVKIEKDKIKLEKQLILMKKDEDRLELAMERYERRALAIRRLFIEIGE